MSGNNKHCVVLSSFTRKPLVSLQTLSLQPVCSTRGFSHFQLGELSGLMHKTITGRNFSPHSGNCRSIRVTVAADLECAGWSVVFEESCVTGGLRGERGRNRTFAPSFTWPWNLSLPKRGSSSVAARPGNVAGPAIRPTGERPFPKPATKSAADRPPPAPQTSAHRRDRRR